MKLRVGLVGLGDAWHSRHETALMALADRFEVRAVCDQVRHRAELAASKFHAEVVDGYRVLTGREDIDAILVLSPEWFGALPILAACESRKAVYCAAGLELDPQEAQKIKCRVEESGIAFVAEFPRRHSPATLRLKELIATRLGTPRLLFCHQRSAANAPPNDATVYPFSKLSHSTFAQLIAQVDWCRYIVDREPTAVTGVVHRASPDRDSDDYLMMSLDFSPRGEAGAGTIAQISCGRYVPADWHEAIAYRPLAALQVSCEKGIAFVDLPANLVWFDEAGRHQESLESERPVGERLLTHFFRSVTSLVRKTSDLEDAYRALCVVQAARRSHAEGRRIEL